jgi:acyl-CoA hydrolase
MNISLQNKRKGKFVSESALAGHRIELIQEEANPSEIFYGSRILQIIDKIAIKVADNHAEAKCKIERIDFVRFFAPAKKGDILICSAAVNRAWHHDMEVGVKVVAEDLRLLEQKDILYAYFTLTAMDEGDNKILIPYLILEDKLQKRRYIEAGKRRMSYVRNSFKKSIGIHI